MRSVILSIARATAWAPLSILVAHYILGKLFGHEPYVDPAMHFSGGLAVAYFFRTSCLVAASIVGPITPIALDLMSFGLTCAAAVVWEIGEFASDVLLSTNVQLDNANTMRDLILGVAGSVVFLSCRRMQLRLASGRAE